MSTEYIVLILAGLIFVGSLFAVMALAVGVLYARSKGRSIVPTASPVATEGEILHAALRSVQDVADRKAAERIAGKLTDHKAGVIQADFSAALSDPKPAKPA